MSLASFNDPRSNTEDDIIGDWGLVESQPTTTAMEFVARDDASCNASFRLADPVALGSPQETPRLEPCDVSFRLADPAATPFADRSLDATQSHGASGRKPATLPEFPGRNATLGGFRILSELGRGAFARVYLAEQVALSRRLVALKVAQALGEEPQALARLQHTHIVSIYSVHDDPETGLRLLCMPYVGGANLAQVLERSGARLPTEASGRSLVEALDGLAVQSRTSPLISRSHFGGESLRSHETSLLLGPRSPSAVRSIFGRYFARLPLWKHLEEDQDARVSLDGELQTNEADRVQPARRFLRSHTYVQAAVWIAARLAEGLDHAHARGILHRDIKPSNILIASDGTPMLLDFNLAADSNVDGAEDAERAHLGGTLPYMAPEHLDAFNPQGTTSPLAVDERSDIYALGLILYEMVAGCHPFGDPPTGRPMIDVVAIMTEERRRGAPPARTVNPMVPPSLEAIIAKTLAPDPSRRYDRAADLAEDLQRFLDDRPNLHAPEPSLRERAGKWWRRHPRIRGAGPVAAMATVLLVMIVGAAWSIADYAEKAQARLSLNRFKDEFMQSQLLLNTTSGTDTNRKAGITRAEKLLEQYHVLSNPKWMDEPQVRRLPNAQQTLLREDLSELILLLVRARVMASEKTLSDADRQKTLTSAIAMLDRAEAIDPHPSMAIYEVRAVYYNALGQSQAFQNDLAKAAAHPPQTARDFYLRGTQRAAEHKYDLAEKDLARAVALDPKRFWAWFVLGICHADTGHVIEAVGDFNACTLLASDFAWPYLNRGLALAASGRFESAKASYDRALELSPDFVEALVNRGLACLELNKLAQAEIDLSRAIALGRRDAKILASRAEAQSRLGHRDLAERDFAEWLKVRPNDSTILVARGMSRIEVDPQGARQDFAKVLDRDATNARAHYGMAMLVRERDPQAALDHANRAIATDRNAWDVLRLRAVILGRKGDSAAVADADGLASMPSPHNLYNAACGLVLLDRATGTAAHRARAREYVKRAIALGFPRNHAEADPDLKEVLPLD